MSYEAFTSMPVIVAALAAWAIGVAGTWGWNRIRDWRQARMLGFSLSEFRWCARRRVDQDARQRAALVRAVLANFARIQDEGVFSTRTALLAAPQQWEANRGNESPARVSDQAVRVNVADSNESAVPATASPRSQPVASPANVVEKARQIKQIHNATVLDQRRSARVIVSTDDQIRDFLVFELARATGRRIKREYGSWYDSYLRWADLQSIEHMPQCTFLRLLGRAAGIDKNIARLKDPFTGRVVKNDAGTPVRVYSYILGNDGADAKKAKRETRQQRLDRCSLELAERRRMADLTPDQTWPEYLASVSQIERESSGLEDLYRKIAA